MDAKSSRRLRLFGLIFILLFFVFASPAASVMGTMEAPYKEALATSLAFGIALLLLAEFGPLIKSFKAGGFEIELGTGVSSEFNEVKTRLANLEWVAADRHRTLADLKARSSKPAPARKRKQRWSRDPWKGRFGGKAERDVPSGQPGSGHYAVSADFGNIGPVSAQVLLKVTGPVQSDMQKLECVEFYVNNALEPAVVPAVYQDGEAEISLIAYRGFTVGVWISCVDVELELDLAELSNAPPIILDKSAV